MSQLNVRINHKYDTYANWMASSLVLNKGEIAVAEIPTTGYPDATDTHGRMTPPAIGIKIGDGAKTFAQLAWIQATAGDVYAWAKKSTLDFNDLDEAFKSELGQYIGEMSDSDTNTTYQFAMEDEVLVIKSKEKTDEEYAELIRIDLKFSEKMNKAEGAVEGNLVQFDANGNAADSGEKIGDFLKSAVAEETYVKQDAYDEKVSDIEGRLDEVEPKVETLETQMAALIGEDAPAEGATQKSIRTIANEELAKQLLGETAADDNFKTLQDLAAWLEEHPESAAAMNEQIQKNKAAHEQNAKDIAKNAEDIGKNAEAIADNKEVLDKLDGADTVEGSVKQQIKVAKEAIEQQIGAVDEKADKNAEDIEALNKTLNGEDGASGLVGDVAKLQEDLSDLDEAAIKEIEVGGVAATVEGNKATISAVPVSVLQNVEGDTLVFNCGTASTVI